MSKPIIVHAKSSHPAFVVDTRARCSGKRTAHVSDDLGLVTCKRCIAEALVDARANVAR